MTHLLDKAIKEIGKLPVDQQDMIAAIILEEIIDENQWDNAFAQSRDQLSKLAEKVRRDVREGRLKKMGFGEL